MLAASRVLVAVAARSMEAVEDVLTMTQFRAMVVIVTRGPLHVAALAEAMQVHPSNATRTLDRLVGQGLVDRVENADDRRHLTLSATAAGRRLVDGVMTARRAAIAEILARMTADSRDRLAEILALFAEAGGEPGAADMRAMGWVPAAEPRPPGRGI